MSSPISGFTAIPNPQMLAFMPIQSYLMMYFAGAGWQIGKRKISAIPNEEFNKMSANDLLKGFTADLREAIPTLESSMNDVTPLVKIMIQQYGDFVREAIKALPEAIGNIFSQSGQSGDSTITNVRLSQGSQQFQRDRELYAGGALSQFQLDQERQVQRTESQKRQDIQDLANQRFIQNQLARQANAKARAILEQTRNPIVPQIARTNLVGKKQAGQSQILERNKLIREINVAGEDWKNLQKSTSSFRDTNKVIVIKALRDLQQKLTNLLARYKF